MFKGYLNKIKLFFAIVMFAWLGFVLISTYNNWIDKSISMISGEISYLRYKIEYDTGKGFSLKRLAALIDDTHGESDPKLEANTNSAALGIPVFVYHGLVDKPDRFSTTPELFKDQMFALKRAGYNTVRQEDFISFIKGKKALPDKSFLLTFDDGRVDSYKKADPILRVLGWSATMFVATDQSFSTSGKQSTYYLDTDQIKSMYKSGRWEIQSHAMQTSGGFITINELGDKGNFLSNKAWLPEGRLETDEEYKERVDREFGSSKKKIEDVIGTSVGIFSYPFSDYGQQTINAEHVSEDVIRNSVSRYYKAALRQTNSRDNYFTFNYMDEDIYRLRRFETPSLWNGKMLIDFISTVMPKSLPYDDKLTQNNGWKNSWGLISFNNDGMFLSASQVTSGSFAFLDGTRTWSNYEYSVETKKNGNDFITLYSRYQSNDNYVSCTFSNDNVTIEQRVEAANSTLSSQIRPANKNSISTYGMHVENDFVECSENGITVAQSRGVDHKIATGGIGLRALEENTGQSKVIFKNLKVVPVDNNQ